MSLDDLTFPIDSSISFMITKVATTIIDLADILDSQGYHKEASDVEKALSDLKNCIDIQGTSGNWNYDPYMHGFYNALELAWSIVNSCEPKYKEAPDKWLCE